MLRRAKEGHGMAEMRIERKCKGTEWRRNVESRDGKDLDGSERKCKGEAWHGNERSSNGGAWNRMVTQRIDDI